MKNIKNRLLLAWATNIWFSVILTIIYVLLLRFYVGFYTVNAETSNLIDDSACIIHKQPDQTERIVLPNGTEYIATKKNPLDHIFNDSNAPGYWKENEIVDKTHVYEMTKHVPIISVFDDAVGQKLQAKLDHANILETVNQLKIQKSLKTFALLIEKKAISLKSDISADKELNSFILACYQDIYHKASNFTTQSALSFKDIHRIVFDGIIQNPSNGIWLPKSRDDCFDDNSPYSKFLLSLAADVNNSKSKQEAIILKTIGTICSLIGSSTVSDPIDANFNLNLKIKVFNPEIFKIMLDAFLRICHDRKALTE